MDGRAGVQPTETDGPVARDIASGISTPAGAERVAHLPLTIREVVRRARVDLDEVERLRAEVDQLRVRAESAEHLLESAPDAADVTVSRARDAQSLARRGRNGDRASNAPIGLNGHALNRSSAANGSGAHSGAANGNAVTGTGAADTDRAADGDAGPDGAATGYVRASGRAASGANGWAPAAMLPRSGRG